MLRGQNDCASKAALRRHEELALVLVCLQESLHDVLTHRYD